MVRTVKIDGQTWSFEESGVRFFLLAGSERALLIDSGMQTRQQRNWHGSLPTCRCPCLIPTPTPTTSAATANLTDFT